MSVFKGPSVHRSPGSGLRYRAGTDEGDVHVTIKVSKEDHSFTQFSVVHYEVSESGRIPVHSYRVTERFLIFSSGQGTITLGDEQFEASCGTVLFCGHGVPLAAANDGAEPLSFFVASYPPGPEACSEYVVSEASEELGFDMPDEARRVYGVLEGQQALDLPSHQRGHIAFRAPDDGESYWQAAPSAGYITTKLAPPTFPLNAVGVGAQLLEPGAMVREHGHMNTDEIICVVEGEGSVFIDGKEREFGAGSMAVLGRNVLHRIVNTGTEQFQMIGIFNPPGIERALSMTGVRRERGSVRPEDIPRNSETGRILVEQFGFVIPGGGG